jgi:hypothetical protein
MKVKITNEDLRLCQPTLQKLSKFDLLAITALKLNKFFKVYDTNYNELSKVSQQTFKKYSIEDAEKKSWKIDPSKEKEYQDEITSLMESEIEIENFDIKLSMLKEYKMSAFDIDNLCKIFINDLEDKKE